MYGKIRLWSTRWMTGTTLAKHGGVYSNKYKNVAIPSETLDPP